MGGIWQDLRLALRLLWHKPAFTATAVLTLAIGMGVNTVAFTVVNGLLFRGPAAAFNRPDLGRVLTTPGGDEEGNGSLADYQRFADATAGALDLGAEGRSSIAWHHDGTAETAWVLYVTRNYFSLIDTAGVAGRLVVEPASASPPSVVIGERFWRDKLGAPSLAGLSLRLNHTSVNVAGILPEAYTGPAGLYSPDIWLPLDDLTLLRTSPTLQARDTRWLFFLGRLRPGSNPAEVQARLDTAVAAMAQEWPDTHRERGARFRLFTERNSELRGLATAAAIGMSLIGLVLLLACFNVTNLLLARAVERERDMGIRTALGARPARLMRMVVAEGLVIASLAGVLALVLARWTQTLLGSFAIPIDQPQYVDLAPDVTVVGFVALLILIAGVLPGLWPALSAARVNVVRVLASQGGPTAGGRPSRLRAGLVGAQVAGSTAFLALAALLVQSFNWLAVAEMGFDRARLVLAEVAPASYGHTPEGAARYMDAMLDRARALPGVTDAALTGRAPFFIGFNRNVRIWTNGQPCNGDGCPQIHALTAGPGYFRAMGIGMAAGREFQPGNHAGEVVVNGPFARQQWSDGNAVGQTIRIGDRGDVLTVIGVTSRHHTRGLDRESPTVYFPVSPADYGGQLTIVVHTAGNPASLVRPIIEAARAVDTDVPVTVKTMDERMAVQLWPFRTVSWLFGICGTLALLLATIGLGGVVIHAVNRRTREFGVRLSVGATPRDLMREVLRGSATLLVPGLVIGIAVAAALARLMQVAFFGVNVMNPLTYLLVGLVECAIVLAACVGPARRASRVDPLTALRSQ